MSFFGFDTGPRGHDKAAPGFSQAHDPFAGLSSRGGEDDALEFDDTYDGLAEQLEETGDAFNDDTFGGDSAGGGNVGKDFDFFGQTAKVADAIEEEHLRFNLQKPAAKVSAQAAPPAPVSLQRDVHRNQTVSKPARTGYEKYRDDPVPDLHVDNSIWGIGPAKTTVQPPQPAAGRKIMSLEEVEAAMRSQASTQSQPQAQIPFSDPAIFSQGPSTAYDGAQHQVQPTNQSGLGHPITILQRPQDTESRTMDQIHVPLQPMRRQAPPIQPSRILQNPNRLSGGALGGGFGGRQPLSHQAPAPTPGLAQLHSHPYMMKMSEDEKTAFLDQETKRAKRNHKIWLLSKDNGLMTPQDKNFITRIQLQQLVAATGNPGDQDSDTSLAEDFYYQVYSHIRAGQRQNPSQPLSNFAQTYLFQTGSRNAATRRHGRPAENHVQRMEQQVQRAVEAAKNKPKNPQLVIAGSLGKISFSNAKTPKPLLSIKRSENETQRPSSGKKASDAEATTNRKHILQNVEKVYDTLMKIEDHVRVMPPPMAHTSDPDSNDQHQEWAAVLKALNTKLWTELKVHEPIGATNPHPFIAFLSCAKGKRAIPRIFPHLNFEQRTTILTMIIYHLDQLDVVQGAIVTSGETDLNSRMRENIELFISTVMPSLMQYFNETGLDIVDGVLNLIATKLNVDSIARTRIGVSMLTLILSRAVLLKQTGAGNSEQWEKWYVSEYFLFYLQ